MYPIIKRIIDFSVALLIILLISPLFILLYIAIKLDSPGPVFFRQKRVGKHKSHFYILKYRSMRIDTPKDIATHLLENPDQYITRIGRFLRNSSLDEIPQLFNILFGKMSIVGPRPALWNQFDLIELRDKYGVNDVPVGLTGWAQVNGRDELPINAKAKLDAEYVKRRSLRFDALCVLRTFRAVLIAHGIQEGNTK